VRVLIVEDAVLLALELESGLTESGVRVVGSAADLDEAIRMLDLAFDVAVLDANLNGRSVTPVADALTRRGIPFIFATGYGEAGAAPAGFNVPVVRKPYNIHQIATALAEALGGP
jgi:CheY-like chemotaxis protein